MDEDNTTTCSKELYGNFSTVFGTTDVPEWEAIITILTLTIIILVTIVGNILVILSVFTYKPLRIVQNFFIVSLAVADLTVAILVLPLNVIYSVLGRWVFGIHVCKMWLTSDVLCCTASILNLCAIALDRFWAITDPINYAQKRTVKRVLLMIAGVWVLSLLISCPPLIGWNDWPDSETFSMRQECRLTARQGYVIYSSSGSFYIPLLIMTIVYVEIFIATKRRLRERAQASKINAISKNSQFRHGNKDKDRDRDRDSVSSETNHNEHSEINNGGKIKTKEKKRFMRGGKKKSVNEIDYDTDEQNHLKPILVHEDSITDNADNSSSSQKNYSTVVAPCSSGETNTNINTNNANGKNVTITLSTSKSVTLSPKVVVLERQPSAGGAKKVSKPKSGAVYQFIEEKQKISLSKERRAARTLGIIMGVFVVCWLPFFLMYVIVPFCPSCCPSRRFINFITWLGYINSVLNPIIYTIFNMDFRRAFRKLLGLKVS